MPPSIPANSPDFPASLQVFHQISQSDFQRIFINCLKRYPYNAKISRRLQIFVLRGLAGMPPRVLWRILLCCWLADNNNAVSIPCKFDFCRPLECGLCSSREQFIQEGAWAYSLTGTGYRAYIPCLSCTYLVWLGLWSPSNFCCTYNTIVHTAFFKVLRSPVMLSNQTENQSHHETEAEYSGVVNLSGGYNNYCFFLILITVFTRISATPE